MRCAPDMSVERSTSCSQFGDPQNSKQQYLDDKNIGRLSYYKILNNSYEPASLPSPLLSKIWCKILAPLQAVNNFLVF